MFSYPSRGELRGRQVYLTISRNCQQTKEIQTLPRHLSIALTLRVITINPCAADAATMSESIIGSISPFLFRLPLKLPTEQRRFQFNINTFDRNFIKQPLLSFFGINIYGLY